MRKPAATPPCATPNAPSTSSGFKADFERECQERGLFELPPPELNGHVERNNGAWRYEFYAT